MRKHEKSVDKIPLQESGGDMRGEQELIEHDATVTTSRKAALPGASVAAKVRASDATGGAPARHAAR